MSGRYKAYPEYKASTIEWIDRIPASWDIKPTFDVFDPSTEKNSNGLETNVLSLSYGNIVERDVEKNFGLLPESFDTYQIVETDDVILRLTDLQNDKKSLRVGIAKQRGIITSAYLKLKPKDVVIPRFAYSLLHSYDITKVFYGMGGGLRQTMRFEEFRRLPIILPSATEQIKIVSFLEHETSKIDTLITKQEKLIELLKEKRQSFISFAVTKGINPNAPMKDSGVEWLGQIPAHWDVKRVRHVFRVDNNLRTPLDRDVRAGMSGEYQYYGPTGVLDYINTYNIDGEYFLLGEDGDHFLKFREKSMSIYVSGKFNVNNHAHLLKGKDSLTTKWGYLFFEHMDLFPWLLKQGVGRYKLQKAILIDIPVFIPPPHEQELIISEIEKQKLVLSEIEFKSKAAIELLLEKRNALITAATTGKIDLRDWSES
jgi:type I restriction enzyme, S subunit